MKTSPFANHPAVNWAMPPVYAYFLTQEEYEFLLHLSLEEVSRKAKILSADLGIITAIVFGNKEGDETNIPLNSLFVKCKNANRSQWKDIIDKYFRNFPDNQPKTSFLKKDLNYAKDHLEIMIESAEKVKDFVSECITRKDFPGTYSFLALRSDDFVHLVGRDEIDWDASDEDLFQIALDNIAQEKMHIQPTKLGNNFDYFSCYSTCHLAAAFLIELERNAAFALGTFGAIVAIPLTEAAFIYPINDLNVLNFPNAIRPVVEGMFQMGELPINTTLYWYYNEKYEALPVRMQHGVPTVSFPIKLMDLLVNLS